MSTLDYEPCYKVGVPISVRVLKSTPRIGGTYLGAFTWVYKSNYQGGFTIHSAANISLANQQSILEIQPVDIPHTLCASVGHSTRFPLKICRKS
jgi:hypothetical protein